MDQPNDLLQDHRLLKLRAPWLGLIGAALALALVVAMLAQARQYALLRHAMQTSDEQSLAAVYEARVQTLQLREQWRQTLGERQPADADGLRAPYAQWQGATRALQSGAVAPLLGELPAFGELRAALDLFMADADHLLGSRPASPLDREWVSGRLPALQALDEPMQSLARAATALVAQRTEQRAAAVRQQNQWGLALTVFMAGLSAAFGWINLGHMRLLDQRRRSLERQAQDLDRARREAEQASEAKSVFLANMSHESPNPARPMQGEVTASSRPGEGNVFTSSLPLQAAPASAADAPAATDTAGHHPATQRLRVLVAEDQPVNRQYLAALLDNLGHHAHFTTTGEEAVLAVQQDDFDLVLMDLHMPVLDGLGATRAIRALPNRTAATVPIVALTADALELTRQRCLVAGMNDFLTKPVSPQKLASSLRRLFGGAVCDGGDSPATPPGLPIAHGLEGAPVIDDAALQRALQAMPRDRLAGLIDAYLSQAPHTVQRLRAAVRDAQPLELRVNAHAAKGAALDLGLSALAATAEALHEGAAHLPAHEIARLVQKFEDLLPLTREAILAAGLQAAAGTVTG